MPPFDPFQARDTIDTPLGRRTIYRLSALDGMAGSVKLSSIPYCIRVLLESCLRNCDGRIVQEADARALAAYDARNIPDTEIAFMPGRVVLQDFTGVPAVVDLAAMRDAIVHLTGSKGAATKVNPLVPCDLVIDHSVQVDAFNSGMALTINAQKEFERNRERYEFLKWGQSAFDNFRVVPPATGIVHQVNLEYLAKVVWDAPPAPLAPTSGGGSPPGNGDFTNVLYPDSLVGTDSHTTMINGLGVVGWGVGGIEAEAVMLGQPVYMLIPEVVGFKLTGKLPEGATATDLVLRVTEMLRKHGVVSKFVEFFGPGLDNMPVANRATIANMSPEYGATIGFFPVDQQTLNYLELTGRDPELIETVEQYCREQGLWRDESKIVQYTDELSLDLGTVEPSLAGPKRPQDRIALGAMKEQWWCDLAETFDRDTTTINHNPAGGWLEEGGAPEGHVGNQPNPAADHVPAVALAEPPPKSDPGFSGVEVEFEGDTFKLKHGSVVIAAITSCTNTSNPSVMIGAGLIAKKAHERGLKRKPWVKTSLAPGSKVVTEYLNKSGLMDDLEALGFYLVGYGCTTCIGNSGPLPEPISHAINEHELVVASVLSGNRNFEGRISPDCRANYLASPPLVVAYALAGTVDVDLQNDPLGQDSSGKDVYLKDLWPTQEEIQQTIARSVTQQQFAEQYANVFEGSDEWRNIDTSGGALYDWDESSTYVQDPPFFAGMSKDAAPIKAITGARCLVKVGDSVTTDHISPAGVIKKDSPAGEYLIKKGVPVSMFNSYGSRRGNDRVMTRGTFANVRVRNQLAARPDGSVPEGGWTVNFMQPMRSEYPEDPGDVREFSKDGYWIQPIFVAAQDYKNRGVPLIVLAGKDYGMGSSRDWAAKGTLLLGVKAVIADSYERIHRSNLVFMGVLPLQFKEGENAESLRLDGTETFDIAIDDNVTPRQEVTVTATNPDGNQRKFTTICRIDTPVEVEYYRNGGILHTVLRKMAQV